MALISLGLIGILSAFPTGIAGVETGRQESMAAFLAEQMVEQVKNDALTNFAGVLTTNANYNQNYNTIPNAGNYRRVVTVANLSPDIKQLQVSVFYRPVISNGVSTTEREVRVFTLVARRA